MCMPRIKVELDAGFPSDLHMYRNAATSKKSVKIPNNSGI